MNLAENLDCKEKPIEILIRFYVNSSILLLLNDLITPMYNIWQFYSLEIAKFLLL